MPSKTVVQDGAGPDGQAGGAHLTGRRRGKARDSRLRPGAVIILMAIWMCLNALDLVITYQGLASGFTYEANRFMAAFIGIPVLAVSVKLTLAVLLLHAVQRIETRTPYSGLVPLTAANLYLAWACLHNMHVVAGLGDASQFLRWYPLAGSLP